MSVTVVESETVIDVIIIAVSMTTVSGGKGSAITGNTASHDEDDDLKDLDLNDQPPPCKRPREESSDVEFDSQHSFKGYCNSLFPFSFGPFCVQMLT